VRTDGVGLSSYPYNPASYMHVTVCITPYLTARLQGRIQGLHRGECGARAYNSVLGVEPQPGSGESPTLTNQRRGNDFL